MSRVRKFIFVVAVFAAFPILAQNPPAFPTPTTANLLPPVPKFQSPVAFFRQLLVMTPMERNHSLTNRTPEARARIMAKVREYQALGPDERELRLRATELRWWLTPLMRATPTDRAMRLEQVPDDLRGLVESRLRQWEILPPSLQAELLASENALQYFAQVQTNNPTANPEQKKIAEQFNQYFELTPKEKQRTLNTLSEAERAAMEKTLKTFEQLPPRQRIQCIRNYGKFAGMSAAERAEFLKNAEQWSKLSPAERQSWRTLVAQIPQMPPMPPPVIPANLIPHAAPPRILKPSMATN